MYVGEKVFLIEFQLKDTVICLLYFLGDLSRAQIINLEEACLYVINMVAWLQNGFCKLMSIICTLSITILHNSP